MILGVDLGHFDPTRAADEARVASNILGSHLLGFEVGNEPNDYGGALLSLRSKSYDASTYLAELAAYLAAMRATTAGVRLYGPDLGWIGAQPWLTAISADQEMPFLVLTQHYYPTSYNLPPSVCKDTTLATAAELLSLEVRERENAVLQTIVRVGELRHREVRISETNDTASCNAPGGPATSPVFASALWSLDWSLRAASAGVAGLNFHGYFGRCRPEGFAAMCEPGPAAAAHGQVEPRPEYYGLLAARQLEGGRFVPTRLTSPRPLPDLTIWATITPHGTVKIALDNLATAGSAQSVLIPLSGYTATEESLTGPSVAARNGVALGDAAVGSRGRWRPKLVIVPRSGHYLRVAASPASATIVTLRPTHSTR